MISTNRKHLKIMSAALAVKLVNTSVTARNTDASHKKREQLIFASLVNMNDRDVEQSGTHAINLKKLCVAKQRPKACANTASTTQPSNPLASPF